MKLIDADAYMEKVRHEAKAMPQNQGETFLILSEWIMEKTPSAKPKQGEWIAYKGVQPPEFRGKHYCSNCYHAIHLASNGNVYNFCPNCGSCMKKQGG